MAATQAPLDLLVGIDGGGSKTLLRLAAPDLSVLAEARGGPANIARDPDGAARSIEAALEEAVGRAGLAGAPVRLFVGAGLAGALVPGAMDRLRAAWTDRRVSAVDLHSDAYATCLGAHDGGDGAVLAVGTGSVGFAINGGLTFRVGGWGFPQGDEGGGAWLGLEAVRTVLRLRDARAKASDAGALARSIEAFGEQMEGGLPGWASRASAAEFATLVPEILRAAEGGDSLGARLLRAAAAEVALLAVALPACLPCCLLGGLGPSLQPLLPADLQQRLVPAQGDAGHGALLMASACYRGAEAVPIEPP